MASKKAWVTLATNDTYSLGALVLAHSLKKVKTAFNLVILVTPNVTHAMKGTLQAVFDEVREVDVVDSGDTENLRLLARPELGITFTKLHCWKLTQYEKCVFLDADTLVLQNCDELFEREELSAAPDIGWPDCFNSGVFVFKPAEETYEKLMNFAITHGSFDGGDQGLLNMYFSDWATGDSSKRLPFLCNMLIPAAVYSCLPAFKRFGKGVKIIHFIGNSKPWLQSFNSVTRTVQTDVNSSHLTNFLQYWWDLFCATVHPQLSPEMSGLANFLSQMKLEEPSAEQIAKEDLNRLQNWEQGNIDYMGRDSFDNIWNKISSTIQQQNETRNDESVNANTSTIPLAPTNESSEITGSNLAAKEKAPASVEFCPKVQKSEIQSEVEEKNVELPLTDPAIIQKPGLSSEPPIKIATEIGDPAKKTIKDISSVSEKDIPKEFQPSCPVSTEKSILSAPEGTESFTSSPKLSTSASDVPPVITAECSLLSTESGTAFVDIIKETSTLEANKSSSSASNVSRIEKEETDCTNQSEELLKSISKKKD